MWRGCVTVVAIGLGWMVASASANASVVYDTLTWENASGNVLETVTATAGEIQDGVIVGLSDATVNTSLFGDFSLLVDANDDKLDIFGICNGCASPSFPDLPEYSLAFQAAPTSYPLQNPTFASGAPINVTNYLSPALQEDGDTAWFTASGATQYNASGQLTFNNSVIGAPEPAGVLVFGMGLVGLVVVAGRRRGVYD